MAEEPKTPPATGPGAEAIVPSAVRAAASRADELIRQQQELAKQAAEQVAQEAPPEDTLDGGLGEDQTDAGSAEPVTALADPSGRPETVDPEEYRKLRAQHDTLRGKYEAETQDLQRRLAEAERRAAAAREEPKPAGVPAAKPRAHEKLTEAEIEAASPELIQIIRKAAREEIDPDLATLEEIRKANEKLARSLTTLEEANFKHDFGNYLSELDRNPQKILWRKLQEEPQFAEFMEQPDRYTGRRRQDLLDQAVKDLDIGRSLAFYEDYLTFTKRGSAAQAPEVGRRGNGAAPIRLETLATPAPGAGSQSAPQTRRGRIWARAEINRFYEDCRRGKYASNPSERNQIEREIFQAENEGRIR